MNVKKHLETRGFGPDLFELLSPATDDDTATFYLWNLSGQLIGYQQYRPDAHKMRKNHPREGKYYTYCPSSKEATAVGGLETYHWTSFVFVVEGLFDAVPLWNLGYACMFTCGLPDKVLQKWIYNQPKATIGILDPDVDAGMRRNFTRCCDVVITPEDYNVHTDLGDSSQKDVDILVQAAIIELKKSTTAKAQLCKLKL